MAGYIELTARWQEKAPAVSIYGQQPAQQQILSEQDFELAMYRIQQKLRALRKTPHETFLQYDLDADGVLSGVELANFLNMMPLGLAPVQVDASFPCDGFSLLDSVTQEMSWLTDWHTTDIDCLYRSRAIHAALSMTSRKNRSAHCTSSRTKPSSTFPAW